VSGVAPDTTNEFMKKKARSSYKQLKMPHLYWEDLMQIEEIIKNELQPSEYKIELGDYEYDNLMEIPKDISKTNELYISAHSPYLSISFTKSSASLFAPDTDLRTVGAIAKCMEVLTRTERKVLSSSSELAMWMGLTLTIISLASWAKFVRNDAFSIEAWIFAVVGVLSLIWWLFSYRNHLYTYSVIEFVRSKDRPNFFVRNKDQIILGILSAIMGACALFILERLFLK